MNVAQEMSRDVFLGSAELFDRWVQKYCPNTGYVSTKNVLRMIAMSLKFDNEMDEVIPYIVSMYMPKVEQECFQEARNDFTDCVMSIAMMMNRPVWRVVLNSKEE